MRLRTALFFALSLGWVAALPTAAQQITGAGSTFVYPVLSKWSEAYSKLTGTQINYQSIGSGGGIAQIKAGTVDFGASDAPLSPSSLDRRGWPFPGGHEGQSARRASGGDQGPVS